MDRFSLSTHARKEPEYYILNEFSYAKLEKYYTTDEDQDQLYFDTHKFQYNCPEDSNNGEYLDLRYETISNFSEQWNLSLSQVQLENDVLDIKTSAPFFDKFYK